MLRDVERVAAGVGLLVRWDKCMWQEVVTGAPEVLAHDAAARLSLMHKAGTHDPIRLLGARIQTKGNGQAEMDIMLISAAAAYHVRKHFWATRGHTAQKCRMLHTTVFMPLVWTAACRCWSMADLQRVRGLQFRLTRRALRMWPHRDEGMVDYLRRAARDCEAAWGRAGVPRWEHAISPLWWNWGGHIARLC